MRMQSYLMIIWAPQPYNLAPTRLSQFVFFFEKTLTKRTKKQRVRLNKGIWRGDGSEYTIAVAGIQTIQVETKKIIILSLSRMIQSGELQNDEVYPASFHS